jgi:hypothetical protein
MFYLGDFISISVTYLNISHISTLYNVGTIELIQLKNVVDAR